MVKQRGFTLLEVLIALAILAISLTALLKATSEDIRDTAYLKDKTIAMMLSSNALTQIQEGRLDAPYPPFQNQFEWTALKQNYYLATARHKTNDPYVDAIDVTVYTDAARKKSIYTAYSVTKGQFG